LDDDKEYLPMNLQYKIMNIMTNKYNIKFTDCKSLITDNVLNNMNIMDGVNYKISPKLRVEGSNPFSRSNKRPFSRLFIIIRRLRLSEGGLYKYKIATKWLLFDSNFFGERRAEGEPILLSTLNQLLN